MKRIRRIRDVNHPLFDEKTVRHGLAFFAVDGDEEHPFEFTIETTHQARLKGTPSRFVEEAIETFLFYNGHISRIIDEQGKTLYETSRKDIVEHPLATLGVSQFHVSSHRVKDVKTWVKEPQDIIVAVTRIHGKTVARDGHTRLKVAQMMGFSHVHVFFESHDDIFEAFYYEARKRNIWSIADVTIVSPEVFQRDWDDFCDAFICEQNRKNRQ